MMSLPKARRLFARLMEKAKKGKLTAQERKILILARQVLRAEKKGKLNPRHFKCLVCGKGTIHHQSGKSIHKSCYKKLTQIRTLKPKSKINPKWFPVTKRKAKWLGDAYRKAYRSFVRQKNPARGTLIYGRVLKIYAQKTSGPYKGQRFVHTFKPGAIMIGMPDGSLRIMHS